MQSTVNPNDNPQLTESKDQLSKANGEFNHNFEHEQSELSDKAVPREFQNIVKHTNSDNPTKLGSSTEDFEVKPNYKSASSANLANITLSATGNAHKMYYSNIPMDSSANFGLSTRNTAQYDGLKNSNAQIQFSGSYIPSVPLQNQGQISLVSPNFNSILEQTKKLLADIKGVKQNAPEINSQTCILGLQQLGFEQSLQNLKSSGISTQSQPVSSLNVSTYTTLDQTQAERVQRALARARGQQNLYASGIQSANRLNPLRSSNIYPRTYQNLDLSQIGPEQNLAHSFIDQSISQNNLLIKQSYEANRANIQRLLENIKVKNEQLEVRTANLPFYQSSSASLNQNQADPNFFLSNYYPPFAYGSIDYYSLGLELTKRILHEKQVHSVDIKPEESKTNNKPDAAGEVKSDEPRKNKDAPIYQSIDVTAEEHIQREKARLVEMQTETNATETENVVVEPNKPSPSDKLKNQNEVIKVNRRKEVEKRSSKREEDHNERVPIETKKIETVGLQKESPQRREANIQLEVSSTQRTSSGKKEEAASSGSQKKFLSKLSPEKQNGPPKQADNSSEKEISNNQAHSRELSSGFNTDGLVNSPQKSNDSQFQDQLSGYNLTDSSDKKPADLESVHFSSINSSEKKEGNTEEKHIRNIYNLLEGVNVEMDVIIEEGKDEAEMFAKLERNLNNAVEETPKKENITIREEGFEKPETPLSKGSKNDLAVTLVDYAQEERLRTKINPPDAGFDLSIGVTRGQTIKKNGNQAAVDPQIAFSTQTTENIETKKAANSGKKVRIAESAGAEQVNPFSAHTEKASGSGQKPKVTKSNTEQQISVSKGGVSKATVETSQTSNPFAVAKKQTPTAQKSGKSVGGAVNEPQEKTRGLRETAEFAKISVSNKTEAQIPKTEVKETTKPIEVNTKATALSRTRAGTQAKPTSKPEPVISSGNPNIEVNQGNELFQQQLPQKIVGSGKTMLFDVPATTSTTTVSSKPNGKTSKLSPQNQESKNPFWRGVYQNFDAAMNKKK